MSLATYYILVLINFLVTITSFSPAVKLIKDYPILIYLSLTSKTDLSKCYLILSVHAH